MNTYRVNQGGLMRCCLLSLDDAMVRVKEGKADPPKEGDRIICEYCKSPNGAMVLKDGVWQWDRR